MAQTKATKPGKPKSPKVTKKDLEAQAQEILAKAEERGVTSNFFFVTTFQRYQVQLKILADLEKAIKEYGPTVTKEYVKGRGNLMSNPAIKDYNATCSAANSTVTTLLNIIDKLGDSPEKSGKDKEPVSSIEVIRAKFGIG